MPRKDAHQQETRLPRWRERLNQWLGAARLDRTASGAWVDEALDPRVAPLSSAALATVKAAYLLQLGGRLGALHCYGLDERRRDLQQGGQRLNLAALYRPLNTAERVPVPRGEDVSQDRALVPALTSPQTRAVTLLEAVGSAGRVLVRGAHGTGKSTFARYLAYALAGGAPDAKAAAARLAPLWAHGRLFPIWVDLRAFESSSHNDGTAPGLCAYIADELGLEPEQLCWQLIAPGGVLLLFDGLERAAEPTAAFLGGLDAICSAVAAPQPSCVIVTTQPYVDHDRLAGGVFDPYSEIDLAPWELEDLDDCARAWYAELLRKGWVDEEEGRDLPGQLCSALRRDEVYALARRPAIMRAIALLHTIEGRLPADPGAFYHRLIDLTLSTWTEGREEGDRDLLHAFDLDGLRAAVAQLVYQAYARTERLAQPVAIEEGDLRAALVPVSRDGRWETVSELVSRVLARPCLLEEMQPGMHSFVDLDLQAYVVSRHLLGAPDLPALVAELAEEEPVRWRPVIVALMSRLVYQARDPQRALATVSALVRPSLPVGSRSVGDASVWRMAWLAGETLAYLTAVVRLDGAAGTVAQVAERLVAIVEGEHLAPRERVEVAAALDRLPGGDLRPGVQAPAGVWCEVPASAFWSGEGDAARMVEMRAYWIARYPVTNAQYLAFVEATGHASPRHWRGSVPPSGKGNHPVVHIAWSDAMAYCAWWNAHVRRRPQHLWRVDQALVPSPVPSSWQARLPTGTEWEMAARGGLRIPGPAAPAELVDNPSPRRRYPWGDSWRLTSGTQQGDETRCNVSESGIGTTTAVGLYPSGASPYGVADLAGNVWEWCLDWADPEGRYKVRRGGAFRYSHDQARCSASDRALPGLGWPYVGFRLVLGPPVGADPGAR